MSTLKTTFSLTADQLNASDITPVTIFGYDGGDLISVPSRLELNLSAGTAYSLTDPLYHNKRIAPFSSGVDNYAGKFAGGSFLFVESVDSLGRTRLHFATPLEGFLDQATEQKRLVFVLQNGDTYKTGFTTFKLRTSVNVASGTGILQGRIYFNQYTVGGF